MQNELFFPELLEEQLLPHHVEEVWLSLPKEVNVLYDVTDTWPLKIKALEQHVSQIGDVYEFREHMKNKSSFIDGKNIPHFEEKFFRIVFSKK